MKPFDYYSAAGEYPKRPTQPRMGNNLNAEQIRHHADLVEQYEKDMEDYNVKKKAYDQRRAELNEEFRQDLLAEFGFTNHPKADKIFWYVWERGHSAGYQEVYGCMSEIAELFDA